MYIRGGVHSVNGVSRHHLHLEGFAANLAARDARRGATVVRAPAQVGSTQRSP